MIRIKGRRDYLVALESVAMTDIVLNMFIFFFISFSLIYTFSPARALSKIDMRLPKAKSAVSLEGRERVTLAVTKEGGYFIDDEKTEPYDLKAALKIKFEKDPSAGLVLRVDEAAKFGSVARALDTINELDIRKVSVAAVKAENSEVDE